MSARVDYEHYRLLAVTLGAGSARKTRQVLRPGASAKEAYDFGLPLNELLDLGYLDFRELIEAGYRVKDLVTAGFDAATLRRHQITAVECRRAGLGAMELKKAGFSLVD